MDNASIKDKIIKLPLGESIDWKFGLITRTICRVKTNRFEIEDTSSGWVSAKVNLDTMVKLTSGEIKLIELDWK